MVKVLVVAQLPPPFLGQPIMIEHLVRSEMPGVKLYHLPMRISREVSDVRRFRWWKFFQLFLIIARIIYARVVWRPQILYFVPASATQLSMFRDFAILIPTRFLFSKTVFHFHSSGHSALYAKLPAWQRWLFRLTYFHADAAIRLSELTPQDGKALAAHREFIVPNGIDDPACQTPPLRPAAPSANGCPFRVLFVSALYEAKGLLVLIEACGQLALRGVRFHLNVMGRYQSDEFEARVRRRIAQLNLEDRVCFLGQLTGAKKFAAFAQSDVLCHPTFHDTFPLVLLEAMALRLPIVATRVDGIPSIVDDSEIGFLTEPNDSNDVANRLQCLAADSELRERMGRAGRLKFEREYALSRHTDRMRRVFLQTSGTAIEEQPNLTTEAMAVR